MRVYKLAENKIRKREYLLKPERRENSKNETARR